MSHTHRRYDRERRNYPQERRDDAKARCGSGAARRGGWVVAVGVSLALVIAVTTGGGGPKRPPAPERLDLMSARRVTEHVADNGVVGAALAAERALAGQATVPVSYVPNRVRPGGDGATLRLGGVRSRDAHVSVEAAKADAVEQARGQLAKQLLMLDPPITRPPSLEAVRDRYVFPNSVRTVQPPADIKAAWAEAKLESNRVWAEVDVEVSAEQLRQLRGEERTLELGRLAGLAVLLLAAAAGGLRLASLAGGRPAARPAQPA